MPWWRRLLLPAILLAIAATSPPAEAAEQADGLEDLTPGSPAEGIYGRDHLALLPDKAVLVFDYRFDGSLLEQPFSDDVVLDFMRHRDDRGFDVDATLFPQSRKLQIGPITAAARSEEHTSELQSLMRASYAVFRLQKKKHT